MRKSWFTIFDISAEGRYVYVSDSVTECTNFEPEEIIGRPAFDMFHPDDIEKVKKVHVYNVGNERMSSMTVYRHLLKGGGYVTIENIIIYCYDLVIGCFYIHDEASLEHKMRISAVDELYFCPPNEPLQKVSTWKMNQVTSITRNQLWINNLLAKTPQKRVCLVLNRFSDNLEIVYASTLAQELLHLDPVESLGQSIYDFLPELDCDSLQVHMDLSKKHDMIFRLRFDWIIDAERNLSEQVEGITSCTDDGLVMVLRLAPRYKVSLNST